MHPIERLRYVARAGSGAGPSLLVREAAAALASIGHDPAGMVTGCRRLIARHPTAGPLWWLAARVLHAQNPADEAWVAAQEIDEDRTDGVVAAQLPDEATVVVLGWPELVAEALKRRGDIEPLIVESGGEGYDLARRLARYDVDAVHIPESGLGAAVRAAGLVLLEASALGPDTFVAPLGSHAAAALAVSLDIPVWVVAGVGRVLPARLYDALVAQAELDADPWDLADEVVPLSLASSVIGPGGPTPPDEAPKRADCPIALELLKGAI
ncbi:MAG: hypothetical protein ACR2H3_02085 [Acidimicrobiales bacterium]